MTFQFDGNVSENIAVRGGTPDASSTVCHACIFWAQGGLRVASWEKGYTCIYIYIYIYIHTQPHDISIQWKPF